MQENSKNLLIRYSKFYFFKSFSILPIKNRSGIKNGAENSKGFHQQSLTAKLIIIQIAVQAQVKKHPTDFFFVASGFFTKKTFLFTQTKLIV